MVNNKKQALSLSFRCATIEHQTTTEQNSKNYANI
jgi:hypothetical protein